MPRKRWVPKNDFCKGSKLDNSEFGTLVQYYFREALFGESRDIYFYNFIISCHFNDNAKFAPNKTYNDSLRMKHIFTSFVNCFDKETYKSLRETLDFKKKPVTIESIGSNFNKMGKYIWENFIVDLHPLFRKEDVFDGLIDLIYEKTNKISSYQVLFYEFLNSFPLYINEENIEHSQMFYLLSKRSKVTRGFKKETFYLEFSRIYFICEVIEKYKIKLQKLSSVEDVEKLDEIVFAATMYFLSKLIENPM